MVLCNSEKFCRPTTATIRSLRSNNGPNSNKNQMKGGMNKAISLLDDPMLDVDRARPVRQRAKISQPLEKPPKLVLDDASRGMLEAIADDIMDNMNEALNSNEMIGTFKGNLFFSCC